MNRRAFLATVAGAIAAPAVAKVAPRVLQVGDTITIAGVNSINLATLQRWQIDKIIVTESLKVLQDNLVFARLCAFPSPRPLPLFYTKSPRGERG